YQNLANRLLAREENIPTSLLYKAYALLPFLPALAGNVIELVASLFSRAEGPLLSKRTQGLTSKTDEQIFENMTNKACDEFLLRDIGIINIGVILFLDPQELLLCQARHRAHHGRVG